MRKNKKVIVFLVKFFVTFFALFAIYSFYLKKTQQKEGVFVCSPLTLTVAKQTVSVLHFFGYNSTYEQHEDELSVKLKIDGKYTSKVIEGCSSISIIILFIAFIIAFSGPVKTTILYAVFGSLLIYGINILRIAFLTVMLTKYPEQQDFFHNLVFPAIIYGTTFLLWVIWVKKFANKDKA